MPFLDNIEDILLKIYLKLYHLHAILKINLVNIKDSIWNELLNLIPKRRIESLRKWSKAKELNLEKKFLRSLDSLSVKLCPLRNLLSKNLIKRFNTFKAKSKLILVKKLGWKKNTINLVQLLKAKSECLIPKIKSKVSNLLCLVMVSSKMLKNISIH